MPRSEKWSGRFFQHKKVVNGDLKWRHVSGVVERITMKMRETVAREIGEKF